MALPYNSPNKKTINWDHNQSLKVTAIIFIFVSIANLGLLALALILKINIYLLINLLTVLMAFLFPFLLVLTVMRIKALDYADIFLFLACTVIGIPTLIFMIATMVILVKLTGGIRV